MTGVTEAHAVLAGTETRAAVVTVGQIATVSAGVARIAVAGTMETGAMVRAI